MYINVDVLLKKSYSYWWACSSNFPEEICKFDKKTKIQREKEISIMMNDFDYLNLDRTLKESDELFMRETIRKNAKKILNLENSNFADAFFDNFMESTKYFLKKSKSFDRDVRFMDMAQAIRNVWIINLLQFLLEKPIKLTDSAFAYSMLYPYTDNVLDSELSSERKNSVFTDFGQRLGGDILEPNSTYEEKLFSLISCFENDFVRSENPWVYESLLLIHNAQIGSLAQQKQGCSIAYLDDILGITFLKGGSSVLADGFIAKPMLSADEKTVIFSFGVLLQLIDDLQDLTEDLKNGHMTIFSQNVSNSPLDNLVNKLLNFNFIISQEIKKLPLSKSPEVANLVFDNCIYMIFEATIRNKKYFSRRYIQKIEEHSKVSIKYLKTFREKCIKKYTKLCKNKNNFEGFIFE